jgi:nickel-dependent lactate racemase
MKVHLAYGKSGLEVEVPDGATVLMPQRTSALADPEGAVRAALAEPIASRPLEELVRPGDSVAIVISDVTRPAPNRLMLPPILETVAAAGAARERVVLVVGTGMHRASTLEELEAMLGPEILGSHRVVNHDARDRDTLSHLMTTARGVEVRLNRDYMEADVRILTGFVEPHIFAGFSGGGKAVLPGIAGAEAVMGNHAAEMLSHPRATYCEADGNPIFEEMREVALASRPTFCANVSLNEGKEITGVFAGDMAAVHEAGMAQACRQALCPIPHPFDIVVATNIGYPADINLYQSVKGMAAAALAVKEGGSIVLASECSDGLGLGEYVELLHSEGSWQALLDKICSPGFAVYDQWGVQCQAMVQRRAEVYLYSSMSRETTESAHLRYCADVSETVRELVDGHVSGNGGREPTVCVLPHGHLTVPRLEG